MQKTSFFFVLLFSLSGVMGQAGANDTLENISVVKDQRLDLLVKKSREVNEEIYYKTLKTLQGFRVQVINTNDRNKAISIKTRMLADFPGENTYLIYHSPYFKVQIGNFLTREEAGELMQSVKKIYPTGVFVVPSKVEIRPSRDGEIVLEALGGG
ncbi:MAG: SPOR domain-containing protein [Chitinophagaceae bacterium]|nr:SPOR domain-containing protein [Chitinophagaceae bacterium]